MKTKILSIIALTGLILTLSVAIFTISAPETYAQTGLVPQASGDVTPGCPEPPAGSEMSHATYCGDYRVNDFILIAITASQWILGIVGSLTLIMFIYGGIMFMISAGSSDKITQAKKIIIASLIGLLIVFSSWLIVRFATSSLGVSDEYVFNGAVPDAPSN